MYEIVIAVAGLALGVAILRPVMRRRARGSAMDRYVAELVPRLRALPKMPRDEWEDRHDWRRGKENYGPLPLPAPDDIVPQTWPGLAEDGVTTLAQAEQLRRVGNWAQQMAYSRDPDPIARILSSMDASYEWIFEDLDGAVLVSVSDDRGIHCKRVIVHDDLLGYFTWVPWLR